MASTARPGCAYGRAPGGRQQLTAQAHRSHIQPDLQGKTDTLATAPRVAEEGGAAEDLIALPTDAQGQQDSVKIQQSQYKVPQAEGLSPRACTGVELASTVCHSRDPEAGKQAAKRVAGQEGRRPTHSIDGDQQAGDG